MTQPGLPLASPNGKSGLTPIAIGAVVMTLAIGGAFGYLYYPTVPSSGAVAQRKASVPHTRVVVALPGDLSSLPKKNPPGYQPADPKKIAKPQSASWSSQIGDAVQGTLSKIAGLWQTVKAWRESGLGEADGKSAAPSAQTTPETNAGRPAFNPDLIEQSPIGPLPVVKNGQAPWTAYAAPYDLADKTVRIAVIVGGLGLSRAVTEKAIATLPERVTLAFSPYGSETQAGMEQARAAGHETLLSLALEPAHFPHSDPGPYTLLTSLDDKDNLARLQWVMSRAQGYVGLIAEFGDSFTASSRHLIAPLREMRRRGVLIVDYHANPTSLLLRTARDIGVPRAFVDHILDADVTRESIDAKLIDLERIAKQTGQAAGYATATPAMLERLRVWLPAMAQRGYALAPITAIVNLQKDTK